jgi:hypothetical protein
MLTEDQIVRIASHRGGSNNIKAVQSAYQALKNLGFTADQIVSIASHDGGSKKIEAVRNNCAQLKKNGFTLEAIVRLARKSGGSKHIMDAILALPSQHEDNFLPSDISPLSELTDQLLTDLFHCDDDDHKQTNDTLDMAALIDHAECSFDAWWNNVLFSNDPVSDENVDEYEKTDDNLKVSDPTHHPDEIDNSDTFVLDKMDDDPDTISVCSASPNTFFSSKHKHYSDDEEDEENLMGYTEI